MRKVGNTIAFYTRNDYLSNHFLCDFTAKGVTFSSMEQFIMYAKAKLFHDESVALRILATPHPQEQKMLGRQVQHYEEAIWIARRFNIAVAGNLHKFQQNPPLLKMLLMTKNMTLVEAAPNDKIWGVGLHENDDRVAVSSEWKGLNLQGQVLMRVRSLLNPKVFPDVPHRHSTPATV